jgi:Tol biopolymer transport system component
MIVRLIHPALVLLTACSLLAKAGPLQLVTKETPLAETDSEEFCPSADFRHVISFVLQGSNVAVYIDADPAREYDQAIHATFSPDSKQAAYVALRNGQSMVVVNGREGKPFDRIAYKGGGGCPLAFSPDSLRLAYVVQDGAFQKVLADGHEGGQTYERIEDATLLFSPDSKHLAYIGRRNTLKVVNLDARELTTSDDAQALTFSPDGSHLAYVVQRGAGAHVVLDGAEGPAWDKINLARDFPEGDGLPPLVFSADGRHFAYEAEKDGATFIVLDGKILARGQVHSLIFSPNGRRVAYVEEDAKDPNHVLTRVIVDGVAGESVEGGVSLLAFTPDSQRIVCLRAFSDDSDDDTDRTILTINDKVNRKDQAIAPATLRFSADGRRMGFLAAKPLRENRLLAWIKEKIRRKSADADGEIVRFDVVVDGDDHEFEGNDLSGVVFTPDLRHWASVYKAGTNDDPSVIVDGKSIGTFKEIASSVEELDQPDQSMIRYGPDGHKSIESSAAESEQLDQGMIRFSPDGRHFAFQALNQKDQSVLVVDGVEKAIDGTWSSKCDLVFDSPTHLHGLFLRGLDGHRDRIIRLEVDLVEKK